MRKWSPASSPGFLVGAPSQATDKREKVCHHTKACEVRSVRSMEFVMKLTSEEMVLLEQLKVAGESGRTIRTYKTRLVLDRLAKGGYVLASPTGLDLVHYQITGQGEEVLAQQD